MPIFEHRGKAVLVNELERIDVGGPGTGLELSRRPGVWGEILSDQGWCFRSVSGVEVAMDGGPWFSGGNDVPIGRDTKSIAFRTASELAVVTVAWSVTPSSGPTQRPAPGAHSRPSSGGSRAGKAGVGSWNTIGRAGHGADVQLDGLDVAAVHALYRVDGSGVSLKDVSGGLGVFVGGESILRARLEFGESFIVGHFTLSVSRHGNIEVGDIGSRSGGLLLRAVGLTAKYRGSSESSLIQIEFSLFKDEVLAVVGPSGSGKSTLCAVLLGDVRVAQGFIEFAGSRSHSGLPPGLVSFVPQADALPEGLTARQALRAAALLRLDGRPSKSDIESCVAGVLRRVELVQHADKDLGALSGALERERLLVSN